MDEQRKQAYRHLFYWAMPDIRQLQWCGWRSWNPLTWRRESRWVMCARAVADWLHNLALYSSYNVQGFNEEWFWRDFEFARARFPEFGLEFYREHFERNVSLPSERSLGEQQVTRDW